MKLLCLSNGHGEDVIAVRILEQLQRYRHAPEIAALPLVGEGHSYTQLKIPIIGSVQKMPSGGFIYMDGRQFWRDLQGGLLQLTLAQYKVVRQWGKSGGMILAVGDIVPLLFAWLSGANYVFVGTAKSDYYLRDEAGWLPQTSWLERRLGSVYLPWERWLMRRRRCQAVFPRDTFTSEILGNYSIPALDFGNPMMDGIISKDASRHLKTNPDEPESNCALTILLLPGSRLPEAEHNWHLILQAVAALIHNFPKRSIRFLAAIAPYVDPQPFQEALLQQGWLFHPLNPLTLPIRDPQALTFIQNRITLILSQFAYADCLLAADLAIAMAGTATEQFVGLGKPAITFPGKGPQFTNAFAEAQTRLLGASIIFVANPQTVPEALQSLLQDPDRWQLIQVNGQRRMGEAGAAKRIAEYLISRGI